MNQSARNHSVSTPAFQAVRLRLRPIAPDDASRLGRLGGRRAQRLALTDPALAAPPTFAVDLPGEGAVGVIAFQRRGRFGPDVGCWLAKPYRGRGYATEALRRVMLWAREEWGVRCVHGGHVARDSASAVVLCRAGFLYTGDVSADRCGAAVREMVWLA
ncbi:MAG TPA: GNAT family N-acetyltransferase [Caulobacteraceae bacterium]|jgi:GNAT superfamily N-acetyltransferase